MAQKGIGNIASHFLNSKMGIIILFYMVVRIHNNIGSFGPWSVAEVSLHLGYFNVIVGR